MDFQGTTREQADEYCRYVQATEPWRLHDLAERMRATGGPLAQMDGSYASLVPLWRWFVTYADAGFPGLGPEEIPSWWPTPTLFDDDSPDARDRLDLGRRAGVASEGVSHYLRLVLEQETGEASWFVYVWPGPDGDVLHHRTLINAGAGRVSDLWVGRIAKGAAAGHAPSRVERRMLERFAPESVAASVTEGPFGASVLEPYLDLDPAEMPQDLRVSPVVSWTRQWWPSNSPDRRRARAAAEAAEHAPAARPPVERIGEDMTLLAGPVEGLDVPAMLAPLDPALVARAAAEAGFLGPSGHPVAPQDLTEDAVELVHRSEAALLHVMSFEGAVRALHVEPARPDQASWAPIVTALGALATSTGARFVPDPELD